MKRKLIKQMCNEWRDNIWLILELAVVSAAMGVVLITVVSLLEVKTRPMGIGPIDDIYVASFSTLNEESPRYKDYGDKKDELEARNIWRIVAALRRNPYVEKEGLENNGIPFKLSYWGDSRNFIVDGDTLAYHYNQRHLSPEAAEILGIEGSCGYSAGDIKSALERGEVVISDYVFWDEEKPYDIRRLIGQNHESGYFAPHRIGAIASFMRRYPYESQHNGMVIFPINESDVNTVNAGCGLLIKVKPGTGKKFIESLQSQAAIASGNVFLKTPVSLESMRKDICAKQDTRLNLFGACMFFLLLIIFLGILGTFWFRIRQRESEIALRRVTGATRGDIFRRIMSESMLLLVTAIIPAVGLDALLYFKKMPVTDGSRLSMQQILWISSALNFLAMTVSILLGAWFPAYRAMKVHPAEALKEE